MRYERFYVELKQFDLEREVKSDTTKTFAAYGLFWFIVHCKPLEAITSKNVNASDITCSKSETPNIAQQP